MLAVLVCGLFNSGLLLGLGAGIVVGFFRARVAIATALAYDVMVPAASIPATARLLPA